MIFETKERYTGVVTQLKFVDKEKKGETKQYLYVELDLGGAELAKMTLPNQPKGQRPCRLSYKKDVKTGLMEFLGGEKNDTTLIAVGVSWWLAGLLWEVEPGIRVAGIRLLCARTPEAIRFFGERFGRPVTFRMGEQQGDLIDEDEEEEGEEENPVKKFVDDVKSDPDVESVTFSSPGHAPVKIPGGAATALLRPSASQGEKRGRGRPKKNPE